MNISPNISTLAIIYLTSFNLNAEPLHHNHKQDHNHEVVIQETHLHGYAEITLALEGNTLEINFESPAANIVGFEHKIISKEQLQLLDKAKLILESPAELFTFSAGNCSLTQMDANFSALLSPLVKDEQHKNDKHHGNSHHDGAHKAPKDSHSEITAGYKYDCPQGAKLNTIGVNLIHRFPRIETIKAMWLTDNKQGAVELTATSNLIQIR